MNSQQSKATCSEEVRLFIHCRGLAPGDGYENAGLQQRFISIFSSSSWQSYFFMGAIGKANFSVFSDYFILYFNSFLRLFHTRRSPLAAWILSNDGLY